MRAKLTFGVLVIGVGVGAVLYFAPSPRGKAGLPHPKPDRAPKGELIPEVKPAKAVYSNRAREGDRAPLATAVETTCDASERARVDAFDAMTDRWRESDAKAASLRDVADFVASFRQVPAARQDECIHRALNLIPDENVMLLAGVLMDRSISRDIVETVFNDILNRNAQVKKPILRQIFADRSHPCWKDVAWIFDTTGEKPTPPCGND